jgi:phosphatidylinositol-3-phosphatase
MPRASTVVKIVVIVLVIIVAGALGRQFFSRPTSTLQSSAPRYFDYIVVVIMENKNLNQTYGNSCIGNCTYVTQLADEFGIAENYSGIAHRSLPNYLTLTSGLNYSYAQFLTDCGPQIGNCTVTSRNIVDSIDATHRSWRAYIEDYSGGCKGSSSDHIPGPDPFLFYTDVYYNATRCSSIVAANPSHQGYLGLPTRLLSDLNQPDGTPNFMWLSPNLCDSGHNACNSTSLTGSCSILARCISQSNEYLSLLVPEILASRTFETKNAALFVTWDEGTQGTCPRIGPTYPTCIDRVPAIFAGPYVKHDYLSNVGYSHYSFARTLEIAWNLPSLGPLDAAAIPMTSFFDIRTLT